MIYFRTGANGAGKTLLTLRDVREKSLAESRPVYYNGRFEMTADFGWVKIDAKDWQAQPDGAIFLFDECHNDFPVRGTRENVPEYVKGLAEHRRRGFDFYLITQHPMNVDAFVRRLIGAPGWHQHLKRASGAALVSVIEWPSVVDQPQRNGAGSSGSVKMVTYPKEVYGWYQSTSLNTAKVRIPFQVKVLVCAILAVPVMGYFGWKALMKNGAGAAPSGPTAAPAGPMANGGNTANGAKPVLTPAAYVASFQPRLEGFAQTAPRYDELTKPTDVPYPAACVQSKDRCQCYTQQATRLVVPLTICQQIVAGGYFKDWGQTLAAANAGHPVASTPTAVPAAPVVVATAAQTGPHPFEAVLPKPVDPNAPKPAKAASGAS